MFANLGNGGAGGAKSTNDLASPKQNNRQDVASLRQTLAVLRTTTNLLRLPHLRDSDLNGLGFGTS
jgi:hypothetical protein